MGWKKYAACSLAFFFISLFVLTLILKFQDLLPWNPQGMEGLSWHLAFNTASASPPIPTGSPIPGKVTLSNFSQAMGLTVQNFVSAGAGIAVLFALIRGFVRTKASAIGNFWVDLTRSVLYVMLPLSLVMSIALVGLGVPQSLGGNITVDLLEPLAVDAEGNVITGAEIDPEAGTVTLDGALVEDAQIITKQIVPLYPQASQVSPKQLGTNGGGILGNNSAHPLENPSPASNLLEMISLLLIPAALCFTFGRNIKDKRQGIAIFLAMFILLVIALGVIGASEQAALPNWHRTARLTSPPGRQHRRQHGGQGDPLRHHHLLHLGGLYHRCIQWVGQLDARQLYPHRRHDDHAPDAAGRSHLRRRRLRPVRHDRLCAAHRLHRRTDGGAHPRIPGKKIGPKEMRMAVLVCLATPIAILVGSGIATLLPSTIESLNNAGAHGFSEVLYAYSSAGGNNGSAFAGMNCNTPFLNCSLGLVMIFARLVPMVATLAIAGSMAQKKKVAASAGTLSTCNPMFVFLLILIVLIVGALSFFPALSLGPIAEFTQMIGIG